MLINYMGLLGYSRKTLLGWGLWRQETKGEKQKLQKILDFSF
jgi:hypothetical protein